MLTKVLSTAFSGLDPITIEVEVNVADKGFPGFNIVGLASKAVEEAKERVKTALINSDIEFPMAKITVNMAPADIPKEGASYDLPIAVGILRSIEVIDDFPKSSYFFGELSLDGSLRHTKGVFLLAMAAKDNGIEKIFVPRVSANEATVVKDVTVYPITNLKELIKYFKTEKNIEPLKSVGIDKRDYSVSAEFDFCDIIGQESSKRALEIAAAGGHNILMSGPPGSGKTMLARAVPGILPPLTDRESLEVTKIYSITGNIPPGGSLVRNRPFRSPHHTTSLVGLIGGGSSPHPGEISLAHRGVLFLDELAEYSRIILESLRQPIEDGRVQISRASGSTIFPSQFMLIAATNPCPCGYLGDTKKVCTCNPGQIAGYRRKLSGPILDRIDLHLTVPNVDVNQLTINKNTVNTEKSSMIKERVMKAREVQKQRYVSYPNIHTNADLKNPQIKELVKMNIQAEMILKQAINKFNLSARTYFRLIKVSQTIADLADSELIMPNHVAEALQYRLVVNDK